MKTLKQTTNAKLKAELFSFNQLVKFSTKGEGKELIREYIKDKKVSFNDITVANLSAAMPNNIKYITKLVDGKYEVTDVLRSKFSTWHILTLIDKINATK